MAERSLALYTRAIDRPVQGREQTDELPHLWTDRLVSQRDRLRHVGPGRLDRLRGRGVPTRHSSGPSSWAATSSTRPGATATARASGSSGDWCRAHPDKRLYRRPPRSRPRTSPGRRGGASRSTTAFPPTTSASTPRRAWRTWASPPIDLQQFHVWEDAWARDERWQRAVDDLKRQGLVRAIGVSVNRWEPANVLETLRTGLIDAVQVIYNIFDQAPEDELFPLCRERNIAVIARVPFDEGTLTGTLTKETRWPEGDWRNTLLRAREPDRQRRPGRGPATARSPGNDHARAGPAVDPRGADRLDDHPRNEDASSTSRPTSPSATASGSIRRSCGSSRNHRWDRHADGVVAIDGRRLLSDRRCYR